MKYKNKFLKEAGVLLVVVLIFSSVSVTGNINDFQQEEITTLTSTHSQGKLYEENHANIIGEGNINTGGLLWDNGLPDGVQGVSCVLHLSYPMDREIVDDFEVTEPGWFVTGGEFRFIAAGCSGPEVLDAVRVYFYQTQDPCKPKIVRYEDRVASFNAYLTGDEYFGCPEIAVDCSFNGVELSPGLWWVCFQPEVEANCFWLSSPYKGCPIWGSMPDYGFPKWTSSMDLFGEDYDVSFKLTGEILGTELQIEDVTGGFGVRAEIRNIGPITADNVIWEIKFDGGIILSPSGGVKAGGPMNISSGTDEEIKTIAIGFGGLISFMNLVITASADNADPVNVTVPAKLLLFLVII